MDRSACRPSCMFICLPSWTDPFADHFVCLFVYYHGRIRLQTILYVYLFTIIDRSACRPSCNICLSVYQHGHIRLQTILYVYLFTIMDRSTCRPSCNICLFVYHHGQIHLQTILYVCLPSWTGPLADHLVCLFTIMDRSTCRPSCNISWTDLLADHLVTYVCLFTIMDISTCRPSCMFVCLPSWTDLLADHLVCLSTIMTDPLADHLVIDFEDLCLLFGYMYVVCMDWFLYFYKPDLSKGFHMKRVLKYAFVYDGVWSFWVIWINFLDLTQ